MLTERLVTRISPGTNERLRLYIAMRRRKLGATVDELCAQGLPTIEELSAELAGRQRGGAGPVIRAEAEPTQDELGECRATGDGQRDVHDLRKRAHFLAHADG